MPKSDGLEDEIMGCCMRSANEGPWIIGIHDCHNAANRCIEEAGLTNPGAPGDRFGNPCDPCEGGTP